MKSLLSLSPALNPHVTTWDKRVENLKLRNDLNCTFGFYFGGWFPSAADVRAEIIDEFNLSLSYSDKEELRSLVSCGMSANDNGLFALARLYVSRVLQFAKEREPQTD